jgi:hypothetical protein
MMAVVVSVDALPERDNENPGALGLLAVHVELTKTGS